MSDEELSRIAALAPYTWAGRAAIIELARRRATYVKAFATRAPADGGKP